MALKDLMQNTISSQNMTTNESVFGNESEIRLLVCGSRDFARSDGDDQEELIRAHRQGLTIEYHLRMFPNIGKLIHGAAQGADRTAATIVRFKLRMAGDNIISFPADWQRYGRAAGPIRNTQMLDEGRPNRVLAFFTNVSSSRGTLNMVNQSLKRGLKVKCIDWVSMKIFYATAIVENPIDWMSLITNKEDIIGTQSAIWNDGFDR